MLKEMRQAMRDFLQPRPAEQLAEVARETSPGGGGRPGAAENWDLIGRTALARGEFTRARSAFRQAVELDPRSSALHHELGLALRGEGEKHAALASFQRAVELQHDHVPAIFHAGQLHAELGNIDEAADCFSLALAFDPLSSAARVALAELLVAHRGIESGIALLSEAAQHGNADTAVFCRLAALLAERGEAERAAGVFRRAIEQFPNDPAPLVNFGLLALRQIGDAPEAETLFRRALQLDPTLLEAQANLGLALQEQGRFEEALRHHEEQLARNPDVVEFRWNQGLANLMLGRYAQGWEGYEMRKLRPDAGGVHGHYAFPEWDGSSLKGRSILVYGEQGIGDEVMFASCLPDVIGQAKLCVVECDARLAPLYRRSFPDAQIESRGRERSRDWRAAHPALELQAAVGSLPRFLRRGTDDFPSRAGYLLADARMAARWRDRLEALGSPPRIGISWRGGTSRTRSGLRSLTLVEILPMLDHGGVSFVVLQRDLKPEERSELVRRPNVLIPEPLADVDELAALLHALDLVISVPNTNVHLAGALGTSVWVLLSFSPEWRYLWSGERLPWYPTARLLRQPQPGDWSSVLKEVGRRLERAPG